jgi:hypothetical protein
VTLFVIKCYSGDQMKEDWQDRVCGICGGREIYTGLFPGNLKDGDNLD